MHGFHITAILAFTLAGEVNSKIWNRFSLYPPKQFGGQRAYIKVAPDSGGGPPLAQNSWFGYSMSRIGDLNEDGIDDLLVM